MTYLDIDTLIRVYISAYSVCCRCYETARSINQTSFVHAGSMLMMLKFPFAAML
jgi:hypothetical protein